MSFLGAWLVTEYVYNPDGTFAGTIRQRRELAQLPNGRIRVTQHCQPDKALSRHPMVRFAGSPVFELSVDGRFRRYHGPAVVGTGISWGEGAMTGRGLWPDFGHNFRSFAVLPVADCQLTGGKFFNATEMIANIAGVAVPESGASDYPTLNQAYRPLSREWQGTCRTILLDGTVQDERPYRRIFHTVSDEQIIWEEAGELTILNWDNGRFRSKDGIGKLFGPLLEMETVLENGRICEQLELLDTVRGHLIGIRRWLRDEELEKVEVVRLRSN
ncbi:hypothetical protein [Candidatus Leptofilum sp.]|uniref:hypothetical protein n=1 Tax=Candidatus Leptofilum sp. TaxID=3241576 RepID=UPI003B5A1442